jgi:antitoxin HigA-1
VIHELCLEPLELSVTEAAKALGVTRKALSELLNGRAGVSSAMALRLAKAFNTTAEQWLALQQRYDLWQARKAVKLGKVRRLVNQSVAAGE